jgi:pimeloyl-ACP methyl ester carboxylesterase
MTPMSGSATVKHRRAETVEYGLTIYDIGPTTFYAAPADPRIAYCLYVPVDRDRWSTSKIVVIVHGTDRIAETYRDAFVAFAERTGSIVVCPLFPAGLTAPFELESYKLLVPELRSDLILLGIIEEVRGRYGTPPEPFLLYGFSGGGHFAHRFLYLHPREVRAVAIGAPGLVTLFDDPRPWWVGTADMAELFGCDRDVDAMRRVAVRIYVGTQDTDPEEIWLEPGDDLWAPGANDAGAHRLERARALHRSLRDVGVRAELELVQDAGHDDRPWLPSVERFFESVLRAPTP